MLNVEKTGDNRKLLVGQLRSPFSENQLRCEKEQETGWMLKQEGKAI